MIKDWIAVLIQIQPKHFRWLHQLHYLLPKSNNHLVKWNLFEKDYENHD